METWRICLFYIYGILSKYVSAISIYLYVSFIYWSVFWPWGYLYTFQTFLDGEHIDLLTKETINELLFVAAERITSRYYELAADVVNVVSWW